MPYEKRQIIEVPFNGGPHPAVIISSEEVYQREGYYICVMITSSEDQDEFSFPLNDGDTLKPMEKKSQVRLHLISSFEDKDIISNSHRNSLKVETFDGWSIILQRRFLGWSFRFSLLASL
ncbi:MAG: type II toxin-antitoxin system PemK/MazF family toxin [Balneolales bacterium]